jgi:hypothetical protein
MATRKELVRETAARYERASRSGKGQILDEFVAITGYHRKHALRLLGRGNEEVTAAKRGRSPLYDEAVRQALTIRQTAEGAAADAGGDVGAARSSDPGSGVADAGAGGQRGQHRPAAGRARIQARCCALLVAVRAENPRPLRG